VAPDDLVVPDLEKVPKHASLIVVIRWNSERIGAIFLPNSGQMVRRKPVSPCEIRTDGRQSNNWGLCIRITQIKGPDFCRIPQ
jgi:hypothetical protein